MDERGGMDYRRDSRGRYMSSRSHFGDERMMRRDDWDDSRGRYGY